MPSGRPNSVAVASKGYEFATTAVNEISCLVSNMFRHALEIEALTNHLQLKGCRTCTLLTCLL